MQYRYMIVLQIAIPGGPAAMRLSKEALSIRVVVRRARRGSKPFVWEIIRDSMTEPVFVSPEAYVSMEAAYKAGHARLAEFVSSTQSIRQTAEIVTRQSATGGV
jgi:hypothetical protein